MQKFLASGDFNALMKKHAKEVLHLLIAKNQKFDILADVEHLSQPCRRGFCLRKMPCFLGLRVIRLVLLM